MRKRETKINSFSKKFRRSAVPEYIWYISLIIIAITLVVGVANITKRANKNIEPPPNVNIQFDVIIDPNNVVKIKTLEFIGSFDLEKDTPNLYLKCGNSYKNMMELFLADKPNDLFTRKATGSVGLKDFDGLILGKNGKAMLFDGKSGYINSPLNLESVIKKTGEISILLFFRSDYKNESDPCSDFLIEEGGLYETGYDKRTYINIVPSSFSIVGAIGNSSTIIKIIENTNLIFPYYFVTLIGNKGFGSLKLMESLSKNFYYTYGSQGTTTNLFIGKPYKDPTLCLNERYFNGTIDEVRIYNRALSDEEIKQCFLGKCPNDDSLVLYLDFEDCTAKDKSGKGNDGQIFGNVTCVDEGILSGVQLYYPRSCFEKGAVWELWYGNPEEGGVMLVQDKVDRKWELS